MLLLTCSKGTNAINYYAPEIFSTLGVTGAENELFATGIYGLVKLIAVIVFLVFVADSLGRRWSLLWTGVGQGLTMLYIGIFIRVVQPDPDSGEPPSAAGYVALICVFLFACMFQFGWGVSTSSQPEALFNADMKLARLLDLRV